MSIFNIPSPLEKVDLYKDEKLNLSFYMKRDDLIHELVPGNKWRKLSEHIGHILKRDEIKSFVTCGGPYSNHLLAAAGVSSLLHIPCIGLIRGDYHKSINKLLQRAKSLGMELRFLSNQQYADLQSSPVETLTDLGLHAHYFIPMGGESDAGSKGCERIVEEIEHLDLRPDTYLIPAGTGTTATGVLSAISYACEVQVYPAIGRESELRLLHKKLSQIESKGRFQIMEAHRCKFGKVDDKLRLFINDFHKQTGILLDPLYNGKMMETFVELQKSSVSGTTVAYHSGGAHGWEDLRL